MAQQGFFDPQHKKPLPTYPKTIGLITSPYGAAIHDMLTVLKRRAPQIDIIIYPSQVQGDGAAAQLIQALAQANQRQECDVLIVARGGGRAEDLEAFNDKQLAQAIFESHLPIVTGIGHDINVSIADLVADLKTPTPSAAAEQVSAHIPKWPEQLQQLQARLQRACQQRLIMAQQKLIQRHQQLRHPKTKLATQTQYLHMLTQQILQSYHRQLQKHQQRLGLYHQQFHTLSPFNTLKRGYALVEDEQRHVIRDPKQVKPKQILTIHLAKGTLRCQVIPKDNSHSSQ